MLIANISVLLLFSANPVMSPSWLRSGGVRRSCMGIAESSAKTEGSNW